MSTRPLIKESLSLLDIFGLNPINQTKWSRIKAVVTLSLLIFLLIEIILDLVIHWNGWESMEGLSAGGSYYQVISKVIFLVFKRKAILMLLSNMENFWSREDYGIEVQEQNHYIHISVKRCIMLYGGVVVATIAAFILKPFFVATRRLVHPTYHPTDCNRTHNYIIMYIIQSFDMSSGSFCVYGFDSLFVSLIIQIGCQLEIIKDQFLTIDTKIGDEGCLKKVRQLVKHHNLVLRCVKDLDKIYSGLLLSQLLNSAVLLCVGMLNMVTMGFPENFRQSSNGIVLLVAVIGQLFIYSVLGTYLTEQCASVSAAVYASDWWVKTQGELRRSFMLVIQRANAEEKLTAGGMMVLSLGNFTSIIRTSFSFFTIARALYAERDQR